MDREKTLIKRAERNCGIDILRIVSSLCIVFLHVTSNYILNHPIGSGDFEMALFLNTVTRCSVPLFVVISGSLFLAEDREYTAVKLWKNNILRLLVLYIVWSFAYYVYQCVFFWNIPFWEGGILRIINGCIYASNHFWFLFMIMGLYALVPMLRTWLQSASKKDEQYVLGLFLVFQILRVSVTVLLNKSLVDELSSMVQIYELSKYLGYFVLGHYLTKYPPSVRWARVILGVAVFGVFANYATSSWLSRTSGQYNTGIADSFGIFVFFQCIALFHYATKFFEGKRLAKPLAGLISNVAKDTLGIYVMHICVLGYMYHIKLFPENWPTLLLIVSYGFVSYSICCLIAAVLRRIPIIGKYLS